jgi:hypothetical protein
MLRLQSGTAVTCKSAAYTAGDDVCLPLGCYSARSGSISIISNFRKRRIHRISKRGKRTQRQTIPRIRRIRLAEYGADFICRRRVALTSLKCVLEMAALVMKNRLGLGRTAVTRGVASRRRGGNFMRAELDGLERLWNAMITHCYISSMVDVGRAVEGCVRSHHMG